MGSTGKKRSVKGGAWQRLELTREEEKHRGNPERGRNGGTELETWACSKAAALDGEGKEKGGEHVPYVSFSLLFKMVIVQTWFSIQYCSAKG